VPRWSRRADKFTVKITYDKRGRAKATIPSPLIMGFDKPDSLTFVLYRHLYGQLREELTTQSELVQGAIIAHFDKKDIAQKA